jgi:DNA-directed RNA polymerase subunit omega
MLRPPIEVLLERTGSKFILISLAAKRARDINEYRTRLGEGLGTMVPPQVESDASKPLSLAFDEIAAGKIVPEFREPHGEEPSDDEPE